MTTGKITVLVLLLIASSAFAQGIFTLGTPTTVGIDSGFAGTNFTVVAPGIPKLTGKIEVKRAATGASGTVLFLSGSMGEGWWSRAHENLCFPFFDRLIQADYDVIQLRWSSPGWCGAPNGVDLGQHILAQRPATAIKAIAGFKRGGRFIVLGSSNGSTQIAYAMALYGAASVIDLAVPVSGPPFMEIDKGCSQVAGYAYPNYAAGFADAAYGSPVCADHTSSWFGYEKSQSVDDGGVYFYGNTKVRIHYGQLDDTFIRNRATDYFALLAGNNQPNLSITPTPKTSHSFQSSQMGLDTLFIAITTP